MIRHILFIILFTSTLFANIGKISAITGDASVQRGTSLLIAKLGMVLEEKDIVQTKENAKLQIVFNDRTIVTIGKNSALDIQEYLYDTQNAQNSKVKFKFFKGAFKTVTGTIGKLNKKKFILQTKTSTIGIRGTIVFGTQTVIACIDGAIVVTKAGQTVFVAKNKFTRTIENFPPTQAQDLNPELLETLESELKPEDNQANNNQDGDEPTQNKEGEQKKDSQQQSDDNKEGENQDAQKRQQGDGTNPPPEDDGSNPPPPADDGTNPPPPGDDGNTTPPPTDDGTTPPPPEDSFSDSTFDSTLNGDGSLNDAPPPPDDTTVDSSFNPDGPVAPLPPPPVVETTEVPAPITVNMTGFLRGAHWDGGSGNLIHEDLAFTSKRVNGLFSYNESITNYDDTGTSSNLSVTNEKILTNFATPAIGAYTGYSNIGSLPYNYGAQTGNYTIYADNTGEFIVGFVNDANFKEVFVVGKDTDKSTMQTNKVYVYKSHLSLSIRRTVSNTLLSAFDSDSLSFSDGVELYNTTTNSFTHLGKNIYKDGAREYIAGYNDTVLSYSNEYKYDVSTLYHNTSNITGEIDIKGTNAQGLAINISGSETKNGTSGATDMVGASYLDKTINTYGTKTNVTMGGFAIALTDDKDLNDSTIGGVRNDVIVSNFNINRSTGDISANFDATSIDMNFTGTVNNKSSYYINDDLMGVLAEASSTYNAGGLVANTGYLVAVPDMGFDANDNPIFKDDDSSWGYWTAEFSGAGEFIDPKSVWVAGIQIPNVDAVASGLHSFTGKVLGSVKDISSNLDMIKMDNTNSVQLDFDFGAGANALTKFDMSFQTESGKNWNLNMNTSTKTSSAFSGTFNGTGGGETLSGSSFNGQFYGDGSLKSVGGKFNASTSSYTADGVFKATKQ